MPIPLQTLEATARSAPDSAFQQMIDWFALQNEQVKANAQIVDQAAVGHTHFLHIDKKTPPFFYPMMPRSAGDKEDNTCPRITVSPDLIACIVGYNRMFEDFSRGIDRDLEGHGDYEGGYVISKLPFDYALKVNEKLVPEAEHSREHWLVAYNEATREVRSQMVGKMFVMSVGHHATSEEGVVEVCVKIALEVIDPEGFQLAPNFHTPKGARCYYLDLLWKDKNDPCSVYLEHVSLTGIERELYESKKNFVAAFLSYENPREDGPALYHGSTLSLEQFNRHEGACDWMGVMGKDLQKHGWASTSKYGAYVAAFESEFKRAFPGANVAIDENQMKVTLTKDPSDPKIQPNTFNPMVSMYLMAPMHGQHWWQHGNMKRMYEPEAGTLMKLRNFPGKEGVKHGEVLSLEQFLDRHHLELEYAVENAAPPPAELWHASGYEHKDLLPGYKRSGVLQKWDLTESNKFLYAASDRQDAVTQGICGALERLSESDPTRPTSIDRFQVQGHRIIVTTSGYAIDRAKLMQQTVYLYKIQTRPQEKWTPVVSGRNPDYPEYRTRLGVPPEAILEVQALPLRVILGAYSLSFVKGNAATRDW